VITNLENVCSSQVFCESLVSWEFQTVRYY